ncbi:hypothetical protein CRE_18750 [Caenorhabditis remanei]|uniref:F-box domain-containing protein n=1 Tax=Caenorhabditis remanei TaxID=31234 RepID=E3LJS3_CAERE|nr:hypothetical protein CRE_18750 [Caenorhabditis remanei]
MLLTLTDMPEDVIRVILRHSDFRSVHSLRKVCYYLRNCIDYIIPEANLNTLEIYGQPEKIYIFYEFGKDIETIEYRKHEKGCWVIQDDKEKFLDEQRFIDVFLNDLTLILKFQSTKLKKFCLRLDDIGEEIKGEVVNNLSEMLKSRKNKLKVQELNFDSFDQSDLLKVLLLSDCESLKTIEICATDPFSDPPEILKIDKLETLEHWKNLKKIIIGKYVVERTIQDFSGYSRVFVNVQLIKFVDLMNVRKVSLCFDLIYIILNTLSTSPNFEILNFHYCQFNDQRQFLIEFGPPWIGDQDPYGNCLKWFIRIPNALDVLEISHFSRKNIFRFKKIRAERVWWGTVQD